MAEGNGSKVIIGCCSAVAVVAVAVVLGLFVLTNKGCEMFQGALESNRENVAAMEAWKASWEAGGRDPLEVSPVEFGDFERTKQSADADSPGFNLEKTGQLDEYTSKSSSADLTVWIAQASGLEMEAMLERIKTQLDSRFSSKTHASFSANGNGYLSYHGSSPSEKGLVVHTGAWLMLLQTNDTTIDLQDVLRRYAEASGGSNTGSASESVPPAEAPDDTEPSAAGESPAEEAKPEGAEASPGENSADSR